MVWSKPRSMAQTSIHPWGNRKLPGTTNRRRDLRSSSLLFALVVLAMLMLGSCQAPLPPLPNPPGPHTPVRLSPGDVLKLSFAEETDMDQVQRIRRDGKISLPFLGEVTAAGKRVIDFQRELIRRYEDQLDNPEVLVTLGTAAGTVIVSGFVNKPAQSRLTAR